MSKAQPSGRKESVLAKLGEKQKAVKASDKSQPEKPKKSMIAKRGKGEQAI